MIAGRVALRVNNTYHTMANENKHLFGDVFEFLCSATSNCAQEFSFSFSDLLQIEHWKCWS